MPVWDPEACKAKTLTARLLLWAPHLFFFSLISLSSCPICRGSCRRFVIALTRYLFQSPGCFFSLKKPFQVLILPEFSDQRPHFKYYFGLVCLGPMPLLNMFLFPGTCRKCTPSDGRRLLYHHHLSPMYVLPYDTCPLRFCLTFYRILCDILEIV